MSYWSILWILPIFIGGIFAFSAIYVKEDRAHLIPRRLGYGVCNMDSILAFSVVFSLMVFTIVVLQLLAYSSLYDESEQCMPILYYFGSTNGCVKSIGRTATLQAQLAEVKNQMNQIEAHKTDTIQRQGYGGVEGFGMRVRDASNWFRQMVDAFYRFYFWGLQQGILYAYRMYYDLRGSPWI